MVLYSLASTHFKRILWKNTAFILFSSNLVFCLSLVFFFPFIVCKADSLLFDRHEIVWKNKPIHFLAKQKNTSLNKNRKAKFVSWHLLYMLLIKSESLGMVCLAHVKKKSKNQNKISRAQCMSYSHSS